MNNNYEEPKGGDIMRLIKKFKYPITIILIIGIIISIIILKRNLNNQKDKIIPSENELLLKKEEEPNNQETEKICHVDIKGAINKPGVYQIDCQKNVNDIINIAGGLTDKANTSVINLAKKVSDEMVIYIYTDEEVKNSNVVDTVVKVIDKECSCPNIKNDGCINTEIDQEIGNGSDSSNKLVNINTASLEELQKIPGVGEQKAKSIIEYRNSSGKFKNIDEILNVNGIGDKLYEQIKIYITT